MTSAKADKSVGCMVRVMDTDNTAKGLVFFLNQTFYEFSDTGECQHGVRLRDNNPECHSFYETQAQHIEVIDYLCYQKMKYSPFPAAMSVKEIYALGGKAVKYSGKCVRIRRICKESDANRSWRYVLVLQDVKPPYEIVDAECYEISPWDGEQPEAAIKEPPPIVQRRLEKEAEKDKIKAIQEQTLAYLKEVAV